MIQSIATNQGDKTSCVVVSDCHDYLLEAEKQLGDKWIYKGVY